MPGPLARQSVPRCGRRGKRRRMKWRRSVARDWLGKEIFLGIEHGKANKTNRGRSWCGLGRQQRLDGPGKARAATEGIREMIMECQSRGPAGRTAPTSSCS